MARFLSGDAVVVAGGGGALGRAIAQRLAEEGAALHLVGRTRQKLEATIRSLPASALEASIFAADLGVEEEVDAFARHLASHGGRVAALVLCASEHDLGSFEETPVQVLDRLYRNNVRASYLLIQRLLPMLKAPPGQVVFLNSSAGLTARVNAGPYAATMHALKALADSLRAEVNAHGVRVLSIFLGRTATPRIESLHARERREYRPSLLLQPEDVAAAVTSALALPRTAEVTDVNLRSLVKSY